MFFGFFVLASQQATEAQVIVQEGCFWGVVDSLAEGFFCLFVSAQLIADDTQAIPSGYIVQASSAGALVKLGSLDKIAL